MRRSYSGKATAQNLWSTRTAAGLLALGVLAGCSTAPTSDSVAPSTVSDQAADGSSGAAVAPGESGAEADGADTSALGRAAAEGTGAAADQQVDAQRRRISRAEVTVTVDDLTEASSAVRGLATNHGGYVSSESVGISEDSAVDNRAMGTRYQSGQDVSPGYTGPTGPTGQVYARPGEARIVLRVTPDQTAATMDGIAGLGEETSRWRTDTDVELQLVDLESRIATQSQSIADLRTLMAKATTVGEIVSVEREISTRTADLESLKAQQASLADA
ncbi:MAG: DUF4349 domain-containing protein, partial [Mobilicoccus sp.]|nr:DUF4349 domain-containing protein [Mobilicoccus sp.]